jgi:hypothetical protein
MVLGFIGLLRQTAVIYYVDKIKLVNNKGMFMLFLIKWCYITLSKQQLHYKNTQ